jgi:hypothetical protein
MMNRAQQSWPTEDVIEITDEPLLYRSAAQLLTDTLYDDISETVGNYYQGVA